MKKVKKTAVPETAEEQYQKLVVEANKEDPWKEPIKDLIDKYVDKSDLTAKSNEQLVISKISSQIGIKNANNFGAVKTKNETKNETKIVEKVVEKAKPMVTKQA